MKLAHARTLASILQKHMQPLCEQFCIAGSIRRGAPEVKDIEIVCVPRSEAHTAKTGLFGDEMTYHINLLHSWATNDQKVLEWIKPNTSDITPWTIKPDARWWRGYWRKHDIKIDVFLATSKNYGAIQLIRTGSREFSEAIAAHAKRIGRNMEDGCLHIAGVPVETPTEQSVFDLLSLQYVAPEKRIGFQSLRRKRVVVQDVTQ